MSPHEVFRTKAPTVIAWLIRDFGLSDFQAAGILGNTGRECLGFTALREIGQPAGRGGYGWQQWTGPRAKLFLNWCAQHKVDWRSDMANYGYLRHELQTDYAYVIAHLHETHTVEEATTVFEKTYERAGVPAMADRIEWAKIALAAAHAARAGEQAAPAPKPNVPSMPPSGHRSPALAGFPAAAQNLISAAAKVHS